MGMLAEELQLAGLVGGAEFLQEQSSEQVRENLHGEEEPWPARHPALSVERNAAAGHDHVQMRMVSERRTPGVQHGGDADPGAKMFGIGGDREYGLGSRFEEEIVDHGFILIGDIGDRPRQREHEVKVADGQQLGLALGEPLLGGGALTLGAMPITTAVVGNDGASAVHAARDVATERRRAAALDG